MEFRRMGEKMVRTLSSLIKHQAGPNHRQESHGRRGAGTGKDKPQDEAAAKPSKPFKEMSKEEQMAQANLKDIQTQMKKDLDAIKGSQAKIAKVSGKMSPENADAIINNMKEQMNQYENYLAGDTMRRYRDYVDQTAALLKDKSLADIDAKTMNDMMIDSVDKLAYQEVESNRQQFTDHGIRHITGNIERQGQIMDAISDEPVSPREKLMAQFIMVNHDVGYTSPLVREGGQTGIDASGMHKEFSAKILEEQRSMWNDGKVFSKEEYDSMLEIVKTHDATKFDRNDVLGSATRLSDNLSMFASEKLPSMFKYVPGGGTTLVNMMQTAKRMQEMEKAGNAVAADRFKSQFNDHRDTLYSQIEATKISDQLKRDLKASVKEVSYMTPKFTLGVLAGEIKKIGKQDKRIVVEIEHNEWETILQSGFNMGQAQTKKFLESYGVTDFSKEEYDVGDFLHLKVRGVKAAKKTVRGLAKIIKHQAPAPHEQSSHGNWAAGRRGGAGGLRRRKPGEPTQAQRDLAEQEFGREAIGQVPIPGVSGAPMVKEGNIKTFFNDAYKLDEKLAIENIYKEHTRMVDQFPILKTLPPLSQMNLINGQLVLDMGVENLKELDATKHVEPGAEAELMGTFGLYTLAKDEPYLSVAKGISGNGWQSDPILSMGSDNVGMTPKDTFRHEFGHHFFFSRVKANNPMAKEFADDADRVQNEILNMPDPGKVIASISRYSLASSIETFAEAFAAYTHPDYKRGSLPPPFEEFYDKWVAKASEGLKRFRALSKIFKRIPEEKLYIKTSNTEFVFRTNTSRYEKQFARILGRYFRDQKEEVMRMFPAEEKASPNALPDRFDFTGWEYKNGKWNKRLAKEGGLFIKKTYDKEGKRVWRDLITKVSEEAPIEGAFDVENPMVQEFLDDYAFKFAQQINATTVTAVRSAISEGMAEGLGMTGIAKLVETYFDNCEKYRAMMIARTETIRASNAGAAMAYEQSGVVEGMQWLVTEDDRTCPLCMEMDGRFVSLGGSYFQLGDRLTVDTPEGRQTMVFDYEAVKYPPLHVMCRCTVVPVVMEQYRLPEKMGLAAIFKHQAPAPHEQSSHGRRYGSHKGGSSEDKYKKDGQWSPERQALHKRIIDKYKDIAQRSVSDQPEVLILAGGTASGKSTMQNVGLVKNPLNTFSFTSPSGQVVNAVNNDVIKEEFNEYNHMLTIGNVSAAGFIQNEASYVGEKIMDALSDMHANFVYDTTGAKAEKMSKLIDKFHAKGYKVRIVVATVPVKLALERSEARSKLEGPDKGRKVNPTVAKFIHRDVSRAFQTYAPKADDVELWDTSGDMRKGQQPKMILSYKTGDEKPTVYDMNAYEKFIDKGRSRREARVITWKSLRNLRNRC